MSKVMRSIAVLGKSVFVAIGILATLSTSSHAIDVTTYHYDPMRTGFNAQETILTPARVASAAFKNLKTIALSEQVDAQPLVISAATWASWGYGPRFPHDVVYVATEGNNVLAIDSVTGNTLLSKNFGAPVSIANLPGQCGNNSNIVGITSTPVIDAASRLMYFVTYTWESAQPVYRIHAIDLATFAETVPSHVITATAKAADNSTITFAPGSQRQRPALLLSGGNVYAGFGSFCDFNSTVTRGWMIGFATGTLTQLQTAALMEREPSGSFLLSSIWMSGYGPAADGSGNIYFQTGNSDGNRLNNYPESSIKMSADLSTVVDYFTPANFLLLDQYDLDRASAGIMVVPDQPGGLQFAAAPGKEGTLYLINRNSLGGYVANGPDKPPSVAAGGCWCGPSYFVGADGQARIISSGGRGVTSYLLPTTATGTLSAEASAIAMPPTYQDLGFMTATTSNGMNPGSGVIWGASKAVGTTIYLQALAAPGSAVSGATSLKDSSGGVWTFGPATTSTDAQLLLNGVPSFGAAGAVMTLDSKGVLWHETASGTWNKFTGSGWAQQGGPPPVPSPAGSTITPTAGLALTDGNGDVWTFGVQTGSNGFHLLRNGVWAAGAEAILMETDGNGVLWHTNSVGGWWHWIGTGWRRDAGPPAVRSPPGSFITVTPGASLTDGGGNVWTFGPQTGSNGFHLLRNGAWAYGAEATLMELDGRGVLWHMNSVGGWWSWTGNGWWRQPGPPSIPSATASVPTAPAKTIYPPNNALSQLAVVAAGNWVAVGNNASVMPTVANGLVYLASYKTLSIWGLAP